MQIHYFVRNTVGGIVMINKTGLRTIIPLFLYALSMYQPTRQFPVMPLRPSSPAIRSIYNSTRNSRAWLEQCHPATWPSCNKPQLFKELHDDLPVLSYPLRRVLLSHLIPHAKHRPSTPLAHLRNPLHFLDQIIADALAHHTVPLVRRMPADEMSGPLRASP